MTTATLLRRFCARGGVNLLLTIIAAWLTFLPIHRWCDYDWFYSILLCSVASFFLAHMVLLPLALLPFAIYSVFFYRRECPVCFPRTFAPGWGWGLRR